jgi:two-component system response regulator DesR
VLGYADATEAEITVVTARFGPVFDRGLVAYLDHERDMRVLRYGLELGELEVAIARESPRVVILGEAALVSGSVPRRLRTAQSNIGVVALIPGVSELRSRQLLAFGITACVTQEAAWSDISAAVRFAAEGKQVFVSATSGGQSSGHGSKGLTRREWEVLQLVQAGRSNPEIASALQIGVETVRSHIQKINRKLGATRRSDLVTLEAY